MFRVRSGLSSKETAVPHPKMYMREMCEMSDKLSHSSHRIRGNTCVAFFSQTHEIVG